MRLAPSLCISHPTKTDIHEIIMHPLEEGTILLYAEIQPHILVKKSYSPHIIPKTKGLEESHKCKNFISGSICHK